MIRRILIGFALSTTVIATAAFAQSSPAPSPKPAATTAAPASTLIPTATLATTRTASVTPTPTPTPNSQQDTSLDCGEAKVFEFGDLRYSQTATNSINVATCCEVCYEELYTATPTAHRVGDSAADSDLTCGSCTRSSGATSSCIPYVAEWNYGELQSPTCEGEAIVVDADLPSEREADSIPEIRRDRPPEGEDGVDGMNGYGPLDGDITIHLSDLDAMEPQEEYFCTCSAILSGARDVAVSCVSTCD